MSSSGNDDTFDVRTLTESGPARDEEDTCICITEAYVKFIIKQIKADVLVKIGGRDECDGRTILSLRSSDFGDDDTVPFPGVLLRGGTSLKHLDLSETQLSNLGVVTMRQSILFSDSLESFAFRHNHVNDETMKLFFIENDGERLFFRGDFATRLSAVDFSHNDVTDEGAKVLANALVSKHTITYLDLSHNHLTQVGIAALQGAVEAVRSQGRELVVDCDTTWVPEKRTCGVCQQDSACVLM